MISALDATHFALTLIAEEGEHHGGHAWNLFELVSGIVNFVIFTAVIVVIAKPRIAANLLARRGDLARQLEEAKTKQAEAERRLTEYAKKLDNLEHEVAEVVRSFEAQGEADRIRLREEAERGIERLAREADFTIRQESLKAQREIRQASIASTLLIAEGLIRDRITDSDRRRLADECIAQIDRSAPVDRESARLTSPEPV